MKQKAVEMQQIPVYRTVSVTDFFKVYSYYFNQIKRTLVKLRYSLFPHSTERSPSLSQLLEINGLFLFRLQVATDDGESEAKLSARCDL